MALEASHAHCERPMSRPAGAPAWWSLKVAAGLVLIGQVVVVLGPRWRLHYYAHLSRIDVGVGRWLARGEALGAVGTTGNAAGKPPHLHYSVFTVIPYPWRLRIGPQGWLRPFFLNPHDLLTRDLPSIP